MNKILRYSFVALLAMIGLNISAQEVTIDFSGSEDVWGIGTTKSVETNSFTYNGITIKLTGTEGNGYRWYDSGNIILGKQGATLEFPAFDFDVSRIDVEGTSGASAAVTQNIFVGDDAVSTETTGAKNVTNQYNIAEGNQAAGTIYTLKVTSNHNTQITKIMIYKKGSSAKDQAGISWSKASATVTIEGNDNVYPTLNNPNNLTVSYASSKEEVATIDASGTITLVAAGSTTISAIFEGNDQYEASTVTYNLTVKEAEGGGGGGEATVTDATVAQALAVIEGLADGAKTEGDYKVTGYVVEVTDISTEYGNATFTIADAKGGSPVLTVFRAKDANGDDIKNANFVKVDDLVVVQGKLQKYVKGNESTPELAQGGKVLTINGETAIGTGGDPGPGPEPHTMVGDGSKENPYTVEDLLAMEIPSETNPVEGQQRVWVKGIIAGALNSSGKAFDETVASNIALAAADGETDATKTVPVQLPTGDMRAGLNVVDNPSNKGKEVSVCGYLLKYMSRTGIKTVAAYILDGNEVSGITNITADQLKNAPAYNVAGQRVVEGYKGLVIKGGKKMIQK
jgi:hypothetical protein